MPAQDHVHAPGDDLSPLALAAHLRQAHNLESTGDPVVDRQAHLADQEVVTSRMVLNYDRVRIGRPGSGFSFFRCVRCRALLEEKLLEQEQHDEWHRSLGDDAGSQSADPDANDGW